MREHFLVFITKYQGASKEGGILKLGITEELFFDMSILEVC